MGVPYWESVRTKQWVRTLEHQRGLRLFMDELPVVDMRAIGNVEQDMMINDKLLPPYLNSRRWPKIHTWALDETRLRNLIRYLD